MKLKRIPSCGIYVSSLLLLFIDVTIIIFDA